MMWQDQITGGWLGSENNILSFLSFRDNYRAWQVIK
jgi:hypothetical protein